MAPRRYFWQIFLSLVFFVLVASALFGFLLYKHFARSTMDALKADLQKETEALAGIISSNPEILKSPKKLVDAMHAEDRITIIAPDGTVMADNWAEIMHKEILENHADRPEVKAAAKGSPIFLQRFSKTIQKELLYYAVPVKDRNGLVFVLRFSFALTTYYDRLDEIRNYLIGIAILSVLLTLPVALVLSRASTRRIDILRAAANRIAEGDLAHRIQEAGGLEFQELAADFNRMADQLNQNILSVQQQHTQTETLLSRMVEGVLALDRHGKAVLANAAFCRMFGLKEDRIQGKSPLEMVRNDRLSDFVSALLHDSHSPDSGEITIFSAEGEKTFFVQSSRILEDPEKEGLVLLVFHDITGIKRLDQVRRDFVANVSHELRTPLTALIGSTEVLLDGVYQQPEESKKFLEIMDKQLRNIENLVSDMLRLAAVEDARTPFRRERISLTEFVEEQRAAIEPLARRKEQQLKITLPDEPTSLSVDAEQLSAAVMNLLDNAVKYTQEGGMIELCVARQPESIRISIRDNGPGIPRELQPRIFERFYRIDKSRSREMGGTGLGLAIARHAVENHGGTLTVQSLPGQGATFVIELPASCIAA